MQAGTVSTNVFLRRLHNFCVEMNWLPYTPPFASRQVPALFGPRTITDSPALQPLHSTPRPLTNEASSRCVRSDGRKLARPSGTARARPLIKGTEGRELRPALVGEGHACQ